MIFLKSNSAQDSFTLEGSLYIYKILNFVDDGDAFTVMPVIGSLRYNVALSEGFGFFFNAGLFRSLVSGTNDASSQATIDEGHPYFINEGWNKLRIVARGPQADLLVTSEVFREIHEHGLLQGLLEETA